MKYAERFYRDFTDTQRWTSYRVKVESTDLFIRMRGDRSEEVHAMVRNLREELERHIRIQSAFLTSFVPVPRVAGVHPLVESMYAASEAAGVGPMAAVAGAIAEFVGRQCACISDEVIIENGGDIWLTVTEPVTLSIFAGSSPFSGTVGIRIHPKMCPLGVCTSSGRIGHSFSFGRADAATILAKNAALSDAVTTETGNRVKDEKDMESAVHYAMRIDGVSGALVIYRDAIIIQGGIELAPLN